MNDNTKSLLGRNLGITYDEMTNLEPSDEFRVLESAGIRISDPQTEKLDKRIDNVTKSKPELFREKIARLSENAFSGGYTIERTKGYKGEQESSISYGKYLNSGVYDDTCKNIPDKPYQGGNVR